MSRRVGGALLFANLVDHTKGEEELPDRLAADRKGSRFRRRDRLVRLRFLRVLDSCGNQPRNASQGADRRRVPYHSQAEVEQPLPPDRMWQKTSGPRWSSRSIDLGPKTSARVNISQFNISGIELQARRPRRFHIDCMALTRFVAPAIAEVGLSGRFSTRRSGCGRPQARRLQDPGDDRGRAWRLPRTAARQRRASAARRGRGISSCRWIAARGEDIRRRSDYATPGAD